MRARGMLIAGLIAGAALSVAACGSSSSDENASTGAGKPGSSAIAVPENIKSSGVINVAALDNYPPYSHRDDSDGWAGLDVELVQAVANKIGVRPEFNNAQFDSMIPSVANGRNDLMVMGVADTGVRRKVVSIIDTLKADLSVVTLKGNPFGVQVNDLCGRTVAATVGSVQQSVLAAMAKSCVRAGKPNLHLLTFPDYSQQYLAVRTRRAQAVALDPAFAAYITKKTPTLVVLPDALPVDTPGLPAENRYKYSGWVVAKDNQALRSALVQAINALIDNGTWGKIMAKYDLADQALDQPLVNGQPAGGS